MSMTIAQKILARASGKKNVEPGEFIKAKIDLAMSHDNTYLVLKILNNIGINNIWNSKSVAIVLDHRSPANSIKTAENHLLIRNFVKKHKIRNFFDVGEGICHQLLPETGLVVPGMLIVGSDSHTTTYGAFGAFATGVGATDIAGVWATGRIWLKVPETYGFNIYGKLGTYVSSKDIILSIIGKIGCDGANYKSCEFYGELVDKMSMDSRMCISNQAMEMGAKSALFKPDRTTLNYLKSITKKKINPVFSDSDVEYSKSFDFNITDLEPQIACPHEVDDVKDVGRLAGIKINQAVLGSCTNGRLEDFEIAAKILKGNRISKNVRFLVIPSSRSVYLNALKRGYIEIILKAGGILLNPGCGPCLGLHEGVVGHGEIVISTTNRNFKGRMGSPQSKIFLASPATVTYSAIKGEISDPRKML